MKTFKIYSLKNFWYNAVLLNIDYGHHAVHYIPMTYLFYKRKFVALLFPFCHPLKGDQPWVFFGRNDAKAETPVLWPPHAKSCLIENDWCWEGLEAGGEGDDRGWDGWMASLTRWMWLWVNSRCCWWTGRPGMLRFMGSQRVGHDWETEMN